jgi:hypothetical protein
MAGRIQLEAQSKSDRFFTQKPELSFFNERFKAAGHFASETLEIEADNDTPDFGKTVRFTIPANSGDLIRYLSVRVVLPGLEGLNGWIESIGHCLFEYVDFIIGGTVVQRLNTDYLGCVYAEHRTTQSQQRALEKLVGKYPIRSAADRVGSKRILYHLGNAALNTDFEYYVDLPFWFSQAESLAVPLCAMRSQEVEVEMKLRDYRPLVCNYQSIDATRPDLTIKPSIKELVLAAEMVYLEPAEVTRLQSLTLDYVITQTQEQKFTIRSGELSKRFFMGLRHPVSELYFFIQRDDLDQEQEFCSPLDYDNITVDPSTQYGRLSPDGRLLLYEHLEHLELTFDGEKILNEKTGRWLFLKSAQSSLHHSKSQIIRRFYSYAFALEPENGAYPSGSLNMDRYKDQILDVKLNTSNYNRELRVLALSHNILRVEGNHARTIFTDNS